MKRSRQMATMVAGLALASVMGMGSAAAIPEFSDEQDARFLALLADREITLTDEDGALLAGYNTCFMFEDGEGMIAASVYVHDAFEYPTRESYFIAWAAQQVYCPYTR